MLSKRHLYSSDLEFFRRNDRGLMPLGQTSLIQDPYEIAGHLSSRTTPTSEPDSRSAGGPRKRVPIACERCRKRKIKCSGNEGDSQSCANCKNSGVQEACRFLRVQSVEACAYRNWNGPRYSPYGLPTHQRLSYVSVPARCSPQPYIQYQTVPSSVDYGGYSGQNAAVDWGRSSYSGQYSPYPGDEETSPYSSHPPDYILPNTDPMSANSGYYIQGHGVRPAPSSLWPESQPCVPSQLASHVSNAAYTVAPDSPQPFQTIGTAANFPSDRRLPNPHVARNYSALRMSSADNIPVSSPGTHHTSSYWSTDNSSSSGQHITAGVGTCGVQEQPGERRSRSYRVQDLSSYSQMSLVEVELPTTSLPADVPLIMNQTQTPAPADATEGTQVSQMQQPQSSGLTTDSYETHKSKADSPAQTYGYKDSMSGRSSLQLRTAPEQLSSGTLYGPRQSMTARQKLMSGDCSPDGTGTQTDSTQTSVAPISNASSGY